MLVDSHCHLNSLSETEKKSCILSSSENSILIDSSIDYPTSLKSLELARNYSFIYSSLGFHPFCAKDFEPNLVNKYDTLIRENKRIAAIGEIGLDYKADISLNEQEAILRVFIDLAKNNGLAVILHNRLASFQILEILDDFFPSYEKVVFHCFSYSVELLQEILRRKGNVSFSLNILRNKPEISQSLKACPLENLLLETDSPYMRVKNRPSSSLDIAKVYSFAAEIKGLEEEKIEEAILANARRIFKI
ncbi:MAG: TatD family hydrolase [Candidatus Omnitrophota bacterium]